MAKYKRRPCVRGAVAEKATEGLSIINLYNPPVNSVDTLPYTGRALIRNFTVEHKHNKSIVPLAQNLRKNMTKEERHLWYDFLRQYPAHFKRQKVIGNYIADFYCAKANLVIELDGSQHFEKEGLEKDRIRTDFIEQYGIMVLRIPNNLVNQEFRVVCEYIDYIVKQRMATV